MAKRSIGIDIDTLWVRAVQVVRKRGKFQIEKLATCPMRRTDDSPEKMLRILIANHGFAKNASAAIAMPHREIFSRSVEGQIAQAKNDINILQKDIHDHYPISPERITFGSCKQTAWQADQSQLIAAVDKDSQNRRLKMLEKTPLTCQLLDSAIYAIHTAAAVNHPESGKGNALIIYADSSHVIFALTIEGRIVSTRNVPLRISHGTGEADRKEDNTIPLLITEIDLSWRNTFSQAVAKNTNVFIAGHAADCLELISALKDRFHCRVTELDPFARVICPSQYDQDYAIALAEGLALRALTMQKTAGINLVKTDSEAGKDSSTKKQAVTFALLAGAIFVLYLVGTFIRLAGLELAHSNVNEQINTVFEQAAPDEKNIVNPLAQLGTKLLDAQEQHQLLAGVSGHRDPLKMWLELYEATPKELDIKIDNLLVTAQAVRIHASCPDYQAMRAWRESLLNNPDFKTVEIQNPQQSRASQRVNFTIDITTE